MGCGAGMGAAQAIGGELGSKLWKKRLTSRHKGGIYTALLIESQAFMKQTGEAERKEMETRYQELARQLSRTSWISEGYVQDRGPGAGGPKYQWTRKVKGKTVSVALSQEQYEWLRAAIENWKSTQALLREMQILSRQVLFKTLPEPRRRKRLTIRVMGLK
jgi:hypothetical protein